MPADDRSRDEWITAFAARLGVEPPDEATVDALLDLAGAAAHASERTAAPLACWLTARAGLAPADALAIAREV
jgi:hypothetical protein